MAGEGLQRRTFLGVAAAALGATAGCTRKARPAAAAAADAPSRPPAVPTRPAGRRRFLDQVGRPPMPSKATPTSSIQTGQEFTLHVSTTASSFRVSAYRVGWYRGAQARLVWRSGEIRGRRQGEVSFASATRTVATRWSRR